MTHDTVAPKCKSEEWIVGHQEKLYIVSDSNADEHKVTELKYCTKQPQPEEVTKERWRHLQSRSTATKAKDSLKGCHQPQTEEKTEGNYLKQSMQCREKKHRHLGNDRDQYSAGVKAGWKKDQKQDNKQLWRIIKLLPRTCITEATAEQWRGMTETDIGLGSSKEESNRLKINNECSKSISKVISICTTVA